jgi:hypothetical protein
MVVWNEERRLGGRFGDKKGHASQFQPPSSSCSPRSCLASASLGSLKYAPKAEDSAVDAGLGFAAKVMPVVEPLKHEPLVDAVDHFASLLAGGVETEVLQGDETVEGNQVPLPRVAPVAGSRLGGEKLSSRAFGGDPGPLDSNHVRSLIGQVAHDLPTNGGVRIEEPFDVRGPGCVIV